MSVREFEDGQEIATALLVKQLERRKKRDGSEYLRVELGDRTGRVQTPIWDGITEVEKTLRPGSVVFIEGRYSVHPKFGAQIQIRELRAAQENEYEISELVDGPVRGVMQMEIELRELSETIRQPQLRQLLDLIFGEQTDTWAAFREAPAAKHYHQAYQHGLLEHCLTVAQGVSSVSATFPGIDRDLAVTGALLHDIGKLDAYVSDGLAIDLTDLGRLQGEIPLGYYRVRRLVEQIEDFPAELAQGLLHIILSHHGSLEHGSPVVPCTREATLVHMIDNLGGKLGSFDRLEKTLAQGAQWSSFDPAIGGGAYFATRVAELGAELEAV